MPSTLDRPTDQPRFEVDLCGDKHWLTDNWTNIFRPVLEQHFPQLTQPDNRADLRVYRRPSAADPDNPFDPYPFSRSAIEAHEQDGHREPLDVLIDAARDSLEVALSLCSPRKGISEGLGLLALLDPSTPLRARLVSAKRRWCRRRNSWPLGETFSTTYHSSTKSSS